MKQLKTLVQGMVKATGKEGWDCVSVNRNTTPVKKMKVVRREEPILLSGKKVVVKSGSQPSSLKKACRAVKKLKHSQLVVVETQSKEKMSATANSLFQKLKDAPDFVTGTSRFGRERKKKKLQSC